jgi:hypothetical protein
MHRFATVFGARSFLTMKHGVSSLQGESKSINVEVSAGVFT